VATAVDINELPGLWAGFARGDGVARDALLALCYQEFRAIARRVLSGDGDRLQIQPTDLAHEAALRMIRSTSIAPVDQAHFLALGARVMRMTLIDELRRQKSIKRHGEFVTLWEDVAANDAPALDLELFDDALNRLTDVDAEAARVVELRFYVGLTLEEIARTMVLSESTVQRRWRSARAWLFKELDAA
jgi:RNA polymerase sigma factor (TIGR02999 family)